MSQKSFNASDYKQPSPLYGPYITPTQLFALQHIERERSKLVYLRHKLRATQKCVREQWEDIDVHVPFCGAAEYYTNAKQYEERLVCMILEQEQKVEKLNIMITTKK